MLYTKAFIPYGGYYSSPFCRWGGSLKGENSVELSAYTARNWFLEKQYDPTIIDFLYFGLTIPQPYSFYGHALAAAVILNREKEIPALQINQVCTTSLTTIALAAGDIQNGAQEVVYALSTDRLSNGPEAVWPDALSGQVVTENIVLDNFARDPSPGAGLSMAMTAELIAKEEGFTRQDCDELTFLRFEQYLDALANDREFQKRYMFPVKARLSRRDVITIEADEGITTTTKEGLAKLKTVEPDGVLTFGSQTHPADGNCGTIVTSKEKAQELSKDSNIRVQILEYAVARVKAGRMPTGPTAAAQKALKELGITAHDLKQVKTHNPFAVNDLYLAKKLGIDHKTINNYGSSIIYGHPQGPTAGRAVAELIEALAVDGGGYGLFTGCAAGDIGAAMIIKVY